MLEMILSADQSMSVKLINAAVNTMIGMGTVLGALILISFIIYLLKPISEMVLGTRTTKKVSENVPVVKKETKKEKKTEYVEVDMNKEKELVAVITAAIMASYNDNNFRPDGLVVRNIRRIKK